MYISLYLIWFHEIHIKYVKRKPPRLRKKEFKRSLRPATLFKTRLWRRYFPVNFVKFLKTLFLQSTSGQLLLQYRKEKRLFLRKQRNSTKECHIIPGKYVNLTRTQYLILPGCLEFVLQIIIQNTSISHARRQTFNRAPNFVKVPRLCTIQSAANSQAKICLRNTFFTEQLPVPSVKF